MNAPVGTWLDIKVKIFKNGKASVWVDNKIHCTTVEDNPEIKEYVAP